jgi:thiamine biosynthesis lipoprotein
LKEFVGYKKVALVENKVVKQNRNLMLDASAIAKGYSCDVVANYFEKQGICDFMIEVGGEVVARGVNSRGDEWVIGITQPIEENSISAPTLQDCIYLGNGAMATSGNYRQFYYKDGKRYSHTINPKTGYPVEHGLLSATVLADDCMTADALATAFMVNGLDWSYSYVEGRPDLAAYFIYSDEKDSLQVKYTTSFEKYIIKK